jgi:hypothetical protein
VLPGHLVGPGFEPFGLNFNSFATIAANQVMMMAFPAGSIEHFTLGGLQRVGVADRHQII